MLYPLAFGWNLISKFYILSEKKNILIAQYFIYVWLFFTGISCQEPQTYLQYTFYLMIHYAYFIYVHSS